VGECAWQEGEISRRGGCLKTFTEFRIMQSVVTTQSALAITAN
jgi:hypothetical protein